MRTGTILTATLLAVASTGLALGQQSVPNPTPKPVTGLNLAFDAPHGQLTASGYALKPSPSNLPSGSVSGTIDVTVTINLATKFKRETTFPCAIMVIGGEIDLTNVVVDGGIETASGFATVNPAAPSTATCTLSIPYTWTLPKDSGAENGIVIAFAAAGVNRAGVTVRSTLQLSGVESLPANGSTSKFVFDATL